MNIIEKKKQEKDNKKIGKRYIIKYEDIIPSYLRIAEEDSLEQTVLEYKGKGIYKDLITDNVIADNSTYDIFEKVDFQFNIFNIENYLKEINKKESQNYLETITQKQKEKLNTTILKARINTLKNAIEELKENEEQENIKIK